MSMSCNLAFLCSEFKPENKSEKKLWQARKKSDPHVWMAYSAHDAHVCIHA